MTWNPNDRLDQSGHLTHPVLGPLVIYQQGGLDSYCGFYAIFNLINFLRFTGKTANSDYLRLGKQGSNEFAAARSLFKLNRVQTIHKKMGVFGGDGVWAADLLPVLKEVLKKICPRLQAHVIAEGLTKGPQRSINETLNTHQEGLALAIVKEGESDKLMHWVVLVGKNAVKASNNTNRSHLFSSSDLLGYVLDSQRGYVSFKIKNEAISFQRRDTMGDRIFKSERQFWVHSLISIT